jgi:putative transposase
MKKGGDPMKSLDEIIDESKDVREVKRALSVKMLENGLTPATVSVLLNVSVQYVRKWKVTYEAEGADGLLLGYQGGSSYLSERQGDAVVGWIKSHETLSIEALRDHLEGAYGIVYQSKQSYYDLLEAGGMSYHHSEKQNPKRDEAQVQARREAIKKTDTVLDRDPTRRGSGVAGGRMSSRVGRCLWHAVG